MYQNAIHPAALFYVYLPGGFAMYDCQIVAKLRDWAYRHAMSEKYDRHSTLSSRQVERNAVWIAMARHHSQMETPSSKDVEISRVVTNQIDNTHDSEKFVSSMQQAREPENRFPVRTQTPGERGKPFGIRPPAELQFSPSQFWKEQGHGLKNSALIVETGDPDRAMPEVVWMYFQKSRYPSEQSRSSREQSSTSPFHQC
jgi:hypothetical protein